MRNIIRRILLEELSGSEVLSPSEIALFNELHNQNLTPKDKSKVIDYIKQIATFLDLDPEDAGVYYELFSYNYKPEGDYEKINTTGVFNPANIKPRRTTNVTSRNLVKAKIPFQGSNLSGRWELDNNGLKYYVILSYRWYPIYLYKENVWYEVTNRYSSTTGKQMNYSDPSTYSDELGRDVILVTKEEMEELRRNATYDDIMKNKVKSVVKDKEKLISKKPKLVQNYSYFDAGQPIKVRFKVTDIREEGDKAIVDVTVDDAGAREGNKMIPSNGGYLRGEVPGVTKERVENVIKNRITHNFKDYIGKVPLYRNDEYNFEITPEKHKIKFNFIHTKE